MQNFSKNKLKLYYKDFDKEKFLKFINAYNSIEEAAIKFKEEYSQYRDKNFEKDFEKYLKQNNLNNFTDFEEYKEALLYEIVEFDNNYNELVGKFLDYTKELDLQGNIDNIIKNLANSERDYIDYKQIFDNDNQISYKFIEYNDLNEIEKKQITFIGEKNEGLYVIINNDIAIKAESLVSENGLIGNFVFDGKSYEEICDKNQSILINSEASCTSSLENDKNFDYYCNDYLYISEIKKDKSNNYLIEVTFQPEAIELTEDSKKSLNADEIKEAQEKIEDLGAANDYLKINNNLTIEYLDYKTFKDLINKLDNSKNLSL